MMLSIRKSTPPYHRVILVFVVLLGTKYLITKGKQLKYTEEITVVCKACNGILDKTNLSTWREWTAQTKDEDIIHKTTTHSESIVLPVIKNKTKMIDEMERRVKILRQNCESLGAANPSAIKQIPLSLKTGDHHICKVPKCGSTFWAEVFLVMEDIIKVENLASLEREAIHGTLQEKILSRNFKSKPSDTLLLVTRNPWHRIYSAYMDKIYRLQSAFITNIKQMVHKKHNYCGEVPTFEQFLEFIASERSKIRLLDPHWRPISNLCRVCSNRYTYVMKLESFTEDSSFVLDNILHDKSSAKNALVSLLTEKFKSDNVRQIVRQFTSQFREMNDSCVNFMDHMRRLWTSLQSQGLISDDIVFSVHYFKDLNSDKENEIVDLFLLKNKERILSESERQMQRNRHFNRAYTSVRQRTLKQIRRIYQHDFVLFEYDQFIPSKLYD